MVIMKNVRKRKGRANCINDQHGFTMVELLIGVVILSLVIIAIGGFIVVGSRSYAAANTEIILQQEAQLAMNQISDVIIDTTRSVNYAGYEEGSGTPVLGEKDADFTFTPADKSLTLLNGVDTLDPDGNVVTVEGSGNDKNYQFYYNKEEEILYYSAIDVDQTVFPASEADGQVVLAEYVTDFTVDLSQLVEKRVVQISMTFENDNKTYSTSNNITIRNKVVINDVELENLDKRIELSVTPKETSVVLEPGETYRFSTPKVTGKNVMDKSVTWDFSDETSHHWETVFKDATTGVIRIAPGEWENSFKVTITTNAVDSEGHHATADVIVYVKRAKSVTLYKSSDTGGNEPNEISPGSTFTISAKVDGNKLGVICSNCGDDTEMDKSVAHEGNKYGNPYVWQMYKDAVWDPSRWLKMIDSDQYSATFYLTPDAPTDRSHVYVIQAMSVLSTQGNDCGRQYDGWVPGAISLTVKEKSDLNMSGNLKYGDEPLTLSWDYKPSWCAVCVRIKTDDPYAPMENDKVVIYQSDGKDIRVFADTFGLDLDHDYYISFQILDYLSSPMGEYYATHWDALAAEYNSHLDSTGTYIGDIHSSSKNTVPLDKPHLTIEYDGKNYKGEEIYVKPISAMQNIQNATEIATPVRELSNTRDNGLVINSVRLNAYAGESKNPSEWTKLYYFDKSTNGRIGNAQIGALDFNPCNSTGDQFRVRLGGGSINDRLKALGTYHYVPYFYYANGKRFTVYWSNYEPDYDMHYYERPESTIHFTITDGGKLNDVWVYSGNNFIKGSVYFPIPSDNEFLNYFALKDSSVQEYSSDTQFSLFTSNGNEERIKFSRITCKYIEISNTYQIELFYKIDNVPQWNLTVEKSAGIFECSSSGKTWNRVNIGEMDELLNKIGGNPIDRNNVTIDASNTPSVKMKDNNGNSVEGKAYIPLPSDPTFTNSWGLVLGQEGTQTKEGGYRIKVQAKGRTDVQEFEYRKITSDYDKNTDTYTIEFFYWNGNSYVSAGKFSCKSKGTKWTQIN